MKTPVVDFSSCILCEICVEVAPHAFILNDAGYIDVVYLDKYSDENIQEALNNCPKDCITME